MKIKAFLEFKDGSFGATTELLKQPDLWVNLTATSQRLIKRYAAALGNSGFKQDFPFAPEDYK